MRSAATKTLPDRLHHRPMRCDRCDHENPAEQNFCGACGARLKSATASATTGVPGRGPSSPRSYTPAHLAERILKDRSALEGERKQVTVLFCDIADATPLAERLGPERMHHVLNAFFDLALERVHRYEGTVNQFLGDGFMALFGAPIALEDHALRAVLAALDIQKVLAERSATVIGSGQRLGLRIGLNSGAVVVGKIGDNLRMDYTAIGDTSNVAARLQGLAEPGTVLASESVWRATLRWVEFEALGARTLKGKAEPLPVFRAVAAHRERRESRSGGEGVEPTPIVGRDAELSAIRIRIDRLAEHEGAILTLVAEAGLGKSRLAAEAVRMARERGFDCFEGNCLSFGRAISYWPFREAIRRHFGIGEDDPEDIAWERLRSGVGYLFPDGIEDLLPYVGTLLALRFPAEFIERTRYLDGLAMGQQVFRSCLRLLERIAHQRPLMVVLEDWHWADDSSVELLSHLLTLPKRAPMLFLVAMRPGESRPALALKKALQGDEELRAYQTTITLSPLLPEDSVRVAENLLAGGTISSAVRGLLLDRTRGNPLFMEEIVRALIESGAIGRNASTGQWETTALLAETPLPTTIEGIIVGRIDRLEDEAKQVLKAAAGVGRSFFYRVLKAVTQAFTALDADLATLQRAELINERRRLPELEYMFQHPLVQQATYNSLLEERRRELHRQVGETLETLFAGQIEEFYPMLAHHFAQAHEWGKAQRYLFHAGDQAGSIAADAEALEHYRDALAASQRAGGVPFSRVEQAVLDRKIGEALFRLGQNEESITYLLSALDRLGIAFPSTSGRRGMKIAALVARLAANRSFRYLQLRRHSTEPPSEEVLVRAQTLEIVGLIEFYRDPGGFLLCLLHGLAQVERYPQLPAYSTLISALGLVLDTFGMYGIAGRFHDRARDAADRLSDPYRSHYSRLLRGIHEFVAGDWVAADASLAVASSGMRELGHLQLWAIAANMQVLLFMSSGDRRCLSIPPELMKIAADAGDNHMMGWAAFTTGVVHIFEGDPRGAVAHLSRARDLLEAVPDYPLLASALCHCALALVQLGRTREALPLLVRGRELRRRYSVRAQMATLSVLVSAETYVLALENKGLIDGERASLLRWARIGCKEAMRHGRRVHDHSGPDAIRLQGMLEWQRGNVSAARRLWAHGCDLAERLGARYVLAQTRYEIGRRFKSRDDLESAERLFMAAGALAGLAKTRQALTELRSGRPVEAFAR